MMRLPSHDTRPTSACACRDRSFGPQTSCSWSSMLGIVSLMGYSRPHAGLGQMSLPLTTSSWRRSTWSCARNSSLEAASAGSSAGMPSKLRSRAAPTIALHSRRGSMRRRNSGENSFSVCCTSSASILSGKLAPLDLQALTLHWSMLCVSSLMIEVSPCTLR
eukprot:Amastigsp_a508847_817.p2 type:complete len:162 gc:universal Amastigsp_a508847_817:486-1(-)